MKENINTASSRVTYFWIFLILLQTFIVIGILSTYAVHEWAKGPGFTASLRYIDYKEEDLNISNDIDKICKESKNSFHCRASKRLLQGEMIYITLSLISCISALLWIGCSVLLSLKKNFYISGCTIGFLSLFSYIMAVFLWIFKTEVGISGCNPSDDLQSSHSLCFGNGFKYNLYLVAYIPLILYLFFLLGGVTLKKLNINYITLTEEAQGMPSRALDETSIHTANRVENIPSD